jgi:2'-5' RNA ligase
MARRLFVAIDLPPAGRKSLGQLNPNLPGVPWLKPERVHLTLTFLGQVEADAEERLRQVLPQVEARAFELEIRGVGTFGDWQPKVLWAGVGQGGQELEALQAKVRQAITDAGLSQDLRPFHPHVTLSRLRNTRHTQLQPFLEQHKDELFVRTEVREFVLYSSEPRAQGSVYRPLLRQALQS